MQKVFFCLSESNSVYQAIITPSWYVTSEGGKVKITCNTFSFTENVEQI